MESTHVFSKFVSGRFRSRKHALAARKGDAGEQGATWLTAGLDRVAALGRFLDRPLTVVDVGCRWGLAEIWEVFGPMARIHGFDPDPEECARLQRSYQGSCRVVFVPAALGPRPRTATLHQTVEPACSSLYPPDPEVLSRHVELRGVLQPAGTSRVAMTTLDAWSRRARIEAIDLVKLDTQGSELGVLKGARRQLRSIRALEIEVEFNPIYVGQPLFGDVDRFLRRRGFVLWRLGHLVHYGLAGTSSDFPIDDRSYFDSRPVEIGARGGQLSWDHAHYVRADILAPRRPAGDWRRDLRDACLVSAWGYRDLAGRLLGRALVDASGEVATAIREALIEVPANLAHPGCAATG